MSNNVPLFLKNKVSRLIRAQGEEFTFTRMGEDDYHQPIEQGAVRIVGVYHETNSFITVSSAESASVQRKKSPMILTLMDDSVRSLQQGDRVDMGSVRYRVAGILDLQNYGVVADISLEMEV